VKILDFGLARPICVTAADDSSSPTVIRKTDAGIVMGTIGYMSPEQVKDCQRITDPTSSRSAASCSR